MRVTSFAALLSLFLLVFSVGNTAFALEQEDRLPPAAWRFQFDFIQTPEYSEAFGKHKNRVPLWHLMVRDVAQQERISGTLSRSEQKSQFRLEYGLSQRWLLGLQLPFQTRSQSSSLEIASSSSTEKTLIQNLGSEKVTGLGDFVFKAAYDASASNTLQVRWGTLFQRASAQSGISRGLEALALGERHPIVSAFVNFTWYPLSYGYRNNFRVMFSNALKGKGSRETLTGEQVDYSGGNKFDLWYGWSLERNNWFVGAELQRQQKETAMLGSIQHNPSWFYQAQAEIGYGNLSDLEQNPLPLPWQIKFGHRNTFRGQNTPALQSFNMTLLLFW